MSISAERNFSKEKTKLDLDSSKGGKNWEGKEVNQELKTPRRGVLEKINLLIPEHGGMILTRSVALP